MDKYFCISKQHLKFFIGFFVILTIVTYVVFKIASIVNTRNTAIIESKAAEQSAYLSTEIFNKKVYVIIFDPIVTDNTGKKLKFSEYLKNTQKSYNDPQSLTNEVINSFKRATNSRLNYNVVKQTTADYFPISTKGTFLNREDMEYCIAHASDRVEEEKFKTICRISADYIKIFDTYKICQDINDRKIDEVWIWGYAWFGFSESALIGPNPFPYNGLTITNTKCNRLIPIMGFNYERGLGEALHDFGHRAEASMTTVYQSWSENRKKTKWDLFGLVKAQSTNFNYSGCGTGHYTPVSEADYDYDTGGREQDTVCDNFSDFNIFNSKDLLNKELKKTKINCKINPWLCTQEGYLEWWFSRFPRYKGVDSDGVLNDWLTYIVEPSKVNEYKAKISFKCTDYNEFGRVFGAKECENKKENEIQCKWFDFCKTCELGSKIIADVCPAFCSQFNNNIQGCISAQSQGLGCVWVGSGVEKCLPERTTSESVITSISPQQSNPTMIDARIIIKDSNPLNLEKRLLVDVISDMNTNNKIVVSNKELIINPLKDILHKYYLGENDMKLDKIYKYKVVPKLDFYNTKNPPSYTVIANQCPRSTHPDKPSEICYRSLPISMDYRITLGNISCYNLGDAKTCDNTNGICAWSHTYGICYINGKKENDEIKIFCSSISLENTCKSYLLDCAWNNNTCNFIIPTATPTPTPSSSYLITVNAKLYDYVLDTPNKDGENLSGIANKYISNLKYKLTYLINSKVTKQEYVSAKFEKDMPIYVKNGTEIFVELIGDIVPDSCKECQVVVATTRADIQGKLTPNNSSVSYNNFKMLPGYKITFGLFLTEILPLAKQNCINESNSYCQGKNQNVCYYYPQLSVDKNECFYCNYGTWSKTQNSLGCFPKKLFN